MNGIGYPWVVAVGSRVRKMRGGDRTEGCGGGGTSHSARFPYHLDFLNHIIFHMLRTSMHVTSKDGETPHNEYKQKQTNRSVCLV